MKRFRKQLEKFVEGILFASSTVTVITVFFIIIFLFKEGLGIFNSEPIEQHYSLMVNSDNPVKTIKSRQIRDIFNGKITNWKDVGGNNDSIILLNINEIPKYYTDDQIGSNFENLAARVDEFVVHHRAVLAYFPESFIPKNFHGRKIPVSKVSIKEFILGREWFPTSTPVALFGVLPLILGTLLVSIGAIILALPIGLVTAILYVGSCR